MLYAILIYGSEAEYRTTERAERQKVMDSHIKALQREHDDGALVVSARLRQTDSATTVRGTARGIIVVDGPFAETKEQLGGLQILNCRNLDHAIEYAQQLVESGGTVEIRPIHPHPDAVD